MRTFRLSRQRHRRIAPLSLLPRGLAACFVSLELALIAPRALASDASSIAEELFREAGSLLQSGNVHEACAKLAESNRIDPQLGTLLNLAACHEKDGKTATAWSEFGELAEKANARGDTARVKFARAHVAALENRLPRVRLALLAGAPATEAHLDGELLGSAAWSAALPLDPGVHRFAFSAAGKKTREIVVTLAAEATTQTIDVPELEDEAPAATPPPAPEAAPAPPPPSSSSSVAPSPESAASTPASSSGGARTVGIVVGSLGIAGVGIGAFFGLRAISDKSDVEANCSGSACSQTGFNAQGQAHTEATVSDLAFALGGVAVGVGLYLILTSSGHSSSAPAVALAPVVGPRNVGVGGELSW
jgi:hypothetical protein